MKMMVNENIDFLWDNLQDSAKKNSKPYHRMVCTGLLYRAYIGVTGIPLRRFAEIEIPRKEAEKFRAFIIPKGFNIDIREPSTVHTGYLSCSLEAATPEDNDVFTIVAKDILEELNKSKEAQGFISILIDRINKWKEFFKSYENRRMSDEYVIGLFGELLTMKKLIEMGIPNVISFWNGPLRSAQDFQCTNVAIEVKTTTKNKLSSVNISSEYQLDDSEIKSLYLIAYRLEADNDGIKLPELIDSVANMLTAEEKGRYFASLYCMGYKEEDAESYSQGYCPKEIITYRVHGDFPRLIRRNVPQNVFDTQYKLSLAACEPYITSVDEIAYAIRENENGEA